MSSRSRKALEEHSRPASVEVDAWLEGAESARLLDALRPLLTAGGVLVDVKSALDPEAFFNLRYWSL